MTSFSSNSPQTSAITEATVVANPLLCDEHHRLVMEVRQLPPVQPGQFVHLIHPMAAPLPHVLDISQDVWTPDRSAPSGANDMTVRRAFSISGLTRNGSGARVEVIYRVVGRGTTWMSRLRPGDKVDLLGPLGRPFTIEPQKKLALLVAGGVGLPPMIFWAQKLCSSGVETVALCGARSRNLLPLEIDSSANFSITGEEAVLGAAEFSRCNAKLIVSTDDGSLGHQGFVTGALENYVAHRAIRADEVRVYTCGPEPMMRGVAKLCERWGFDCQLCMERSMACGMGTCQSCVVPVRDESAADGWRYKLCCTDGPIFERSELIWN